jgi:hypothetical protein
MPPSVNELDKRKPLLIKLTPGPYVIGVAILEP